MDWSINKDLLRLADIYTWDCVGNWVGWTFPDLPDILIPQKKLLLSSLTGLAPIHRQSKDSWGWGRSSFYSVVNGFSELQDVPLSNLSSTI